ncbi:Zn(II)2Cys6 transcription factor domain-containing protein [Aspergillus brunneoviolaceus CBS 621.78]|uniref:Uncharacterized protein n=1 Tax=Aspergillus brunneoviolaceus CBS 621.78 TaxID=1450534 RepID=A0ACD1GDX6_9EURO|nr:hypothetical protein BO95DRAFT_480873 [Aspergillus brunneoviolaceus CBS 621.78]RAH47377.1 hypothetical protein BO95DRAFT_480873 [Aspergillus brunneoviolaceus CBS 621.78]
MTQPPSGAASDSGSRNPRPSRRHACDRCRSQKLRCDRTAHRMNISIVCDRCARNHFACVTSAPMPMGRPRSSNPKARCRRKTNKTSDELGSTTPPSCSTIQQPPDLAMARLEMDAINDLPDLHFNQGDLGYDLGSLSMDVFDTFAFADMAMSSQPEAVGPTNSAAVNPQEQNVEHLWRLHSTLPDHVYRIESQAISQIDPSKNESLPDTHPFGPQWSDVANTQSDHPMHQMMRCSQTFLEIIQSFVSSYRQSSLVARYSPAGNLTGPLAVLDNFAGSVPLSDVHLNGSTLKLDGVQQVTTVLQLSCNLLERIDRGVEILLTGAGHILSAPGTYMSVLDALVQQEARSGRGPTLPDGSGSTGGRAARLAPSRLLVQKIRRCINITCL